MQQRRRRRRNVPADHGWIEELQRYIDQISASLAMQRAEILQLRRAVDEAEASSGREAGTEPLSNEPHDIAAVEDQNPLQNV